MKEIMSLKMVAMEIGKIQFFNYHSNGLKNYLSETWTLQIQTITENIELIGKY